MLLRSTILLAVVLALPPKADAAALGTAINYQGYLADKNKPATGLYDFTFKLYDAATAGSLMGSPNTVSLNSVPVSNGWFSSALDFRASAFQGAARWVEIRSLDPPSSTICAAPTTEGDPRGGGQRSS